MDEKRDRFSPILKNAIAFPFCKQLNMVKSLKTANLRHILSFYFIEIFQ